MKHCAVSVTIAFAIIAIVASQTASAQVEFGLKAPSGQLFLAFPATEHIQVEAGVPPIGFFTGNLPVIVDGKYYFSPLTETRPDTQVASIGDFFQMASNEVSGLFGNDSDGGATPGTTSGVQLTPYVGAGASLVIVESVVIFSPHGLGGLEFRLGELPLIPFVELRVGMSFGEFGIGFGFAPQIGARFAF